jgi:DNA-binding NarL/FixJ family response regulator
MHAGRSGDRVPDGRLHRMRAMAGTLGRRGGSILVVDDEEGVHRTIARYLAPWPIVAAYGAHQAIERLAEIHDLRLAVVDLNLPDALPDEEHAHQPWFALPARIRRLHPGVPIIIFSAHVTGELVNAAHRLGAEYIFKENHAANWTHVAKRLELTHLVDDWKRATYLQNLRDRAKLSKRQVDVAALAMRGLGPVEIASVLGISRNSVKRHAENLRRKTGHGTLRALARDVAAL